MERDAKCARRAVIDYARGATMRRTLLFFVLVLGLVLAMAEPARAHQQSIQNFQVAVHDDRIDVRALVYPSDVLGGARPVAANDLIASGDAVAATVMRWVIAGDERGPCPTDRATITIADDPRFGEVRWTARCAAPITTLVLDFRGLFSIDRTLSALVKIEGLSDEDYAPLVDARDPILHVTVGEPPPSTLLAYVRTGVDHIFSGRDHIAFILALLLVVLLARGPDGRWHQKPLVPSLRTTAGIVTAFTIAHSLTLISASLGWVRLPSRFVESMIALSIAYTALEDVVKPDVRWRFALTFGFGLIHGLGFASVLARLLPPHDVVVPLLAFNVGVELGQLTIVCIALPTFALVCRALGAERYRRVFLPIAAAVIFALGLIWIVERVVGVTILGL
jgi:hypothetical protein